VKRRAAAATFALFAPAMVWQVASADATVEAAPCQLVTLDPATGLPVTVNNSCVAPPPQPPPPTTAPTTSPPAVTTPPTTAPPPTEAPSGTVDPGTTPTTAAPGSTGSPGATDTTGSTDTTVAGSTAPAETTTSTTVPEVVVEALVTVPPPPESGRVLVPTGVVESGSTRPITFPVAGPVRYFNDFGACRAGCSRQHQGNDIIGDRLQPILAMRDGIVDRLLDHPTAGFGVVIQDAEGWEYHVYHVNNDTPGTDDGADGGTWRYAPGIVPGAPVTAGQVIAWMGDSGNSEGSVPHAHVEIHTPSGAAINPYWSLRLAQHDVNCATQQAATPPAEAPQSGLLDGPRFLAAGWSSDEVLASLPGEWSALRLTGGRPTSNDVAARLWINPSGFTPVDAAAVLVGDRRYDEDCSQPPSVLVPPNIPAELGAILATIRAMETGGNYTTQVTSSTASGAYGFLDGTWGGYGGYRRARDAPPPVQDAKAAELATYILNRNGGDVSTVPVSWYIGHVPIGAEWDTVPPVGANVITPRQYQARWMAMYARILGMPDAWVGVAPPWTAVDTTVTCQTVVVDLGPPGQPAYALTQAHAFTTDAAGRAVPTTGDACDPHRGPAPSPASTATPTVPAAVTGPR
jgi:hypothetical protein